MNNYCFLHICTIGDRFQQITNEILELIQTSNLLPHLKKIYISIAGTDAVQLPSWQQIKVDPTRKLLTDFEFTTLNLIQQFSKIKEGNILYIHTKGVSTPPNICIDEWRKYMLFFNIVKFNKALQLLEDYDAVGVDLVDTPVLHFSGNMWWSKTSHINSLPCFQNMPSILSERHKAEFWVCSNPTSSYISLHNSNIDVYSRHLTRYPKELYENFN